MECQSVGQLAKATVGGRMTMNELFLDIRFRRIHSLGYNSNHTKQCGHNRDHHADIYQKGNEVNYIHVDRIIEYSIVGHSAYSAVSQNRKKIAAALSLSGQSLPSRQWRAGRWRRCSTVRPRQSGDGRCRACTFSVVRP